jgi:hypothetical protein
MPFPEPISKVFGIGWTISEEPVSPNDLRYVATIATYSQPGKGMPAAELPPFTEEKRYLLEIRPKWSRPSDDDISGVLGLLSPWGTPEDKKAHGDLERALSEIQMWALYRCLGEAKKEKTRTAILLLGPLLPKLRGRIFYRMLDVMRTPIYIITSQPRWVARFAEERRDQWIPCLGYTTEFTAPAEHIWLGPFPDLAIDASGRDFCGVKGGREVVSIHVPANALPANDAQKCFDQCKSDFTDLFEDFQPIAAHFNTEVPSVLCRAVVAAERAKNVVLSTIRGGTSSVDGLHEAELHPSKKDGYGTVKPAGTPTDGFPQKRTRRNVKQWLRTEAMGLRPELRGRFRRDHLEPVLDFLFKELKEEDFEEQVLLDLRTRLVNEDTKIFNNFKTEQAIKSLRRRWSRRSVEEM